jgi:hypothetical protein
MSEAIVNKLKGAVVGIIRRERATESLRRIMSRRPGRRQKAAVSSVLKTQSKRIQ